MSPMPDRSGTTMKKRASGKKSSGDRKQRLAAALRANLQRRKSQARQRQAGGTEKSKSKTDSE